MHKQVPGYTTSRIAFLQLSLFFDILLAMCEGVTEEEYISGERGTSYVKHLMSLGETEAILEPRRKARVLLWKELHGLKLRVCK